MADKPVFARGTKVAVINRSWSGKYLVEGYATIVRSLDIPNQAITSIYEVDFGDGSGVVERYIDSAAQSNPEDFVQRLNASLSEREQGEK